MCRRRMSLTLVGFVRTSLIVVPDNALKASFVGARIVTLRPFNSSAMPDRLSACSIALKSPSLSACLASSARWLAVAVSSVEPDEPESVLALELLVLLVLLVLDEVPVVSLVAVLLELDEVV